MEKMKINALITFSVLLATLLPSCSGDNGNNQVNSLIGEWQMIERYDGGSPQPVQHAENGKTIVFNGSGTFTDSFLENCSGTYSLSGDTITIKRSCKLENEQYRFGHENGRLRLMAIPSTCDEGCYEIYKRI